MDTRMISHTLENGNKFLIYGSTQKVVFLQKSFCVLPVFINILKEIRRLRDYGNSVILYKCEKMFSEP